MAALDATRMEPLPYCISHDSIRGTYLKTRLKGMFLAFDLARARLDLHGWKLRYDDVGG